MEQSLSESGVTPNLSADLSAKSVRRPNCYKSLPSSHLQERDRGVEPLSQPWEGWARPIYQSRTRENDNTRGGRGKGEIVVQARSACHLRPPVVRNQHDLSGFTLCGRHRGACLLLSRETPMRHTVLTLALLRSSRRSPGSRSRSCPRASRRTATSPTARTRNATRSTCSRPSPTSRRRSSSGSTAARGSRAARTAATRRCGFWKRATPSPRSTTASASTRSSRRRSRTAKRRCGSCGRTPRRSTSTRTPSARGGRRPAGTSSPSSAPAET